MDQRSDLQCLARIISIIVNYELGKEDLLEYTVKSAYRFLYKKNKLYQIESILLDFMRKTMPKIHTQKQLIDAFLKLRTLIIDAHKDPFERNMLHYFDFISWLESKIESRPFAEIIKEKVKRYRK